MQTVFTYEPDKKELFVRKSEIYRYLGYTKDAPKGDEVEKLIDEILEKVIQHSKPIVCYKRFPLHLGQDIDMGFVKIQSKDLSVNLQNCQEVLVFAATIGLYTDMQIKREAILSPARACVYQAVGAAVVEEVCDNFNEYIRKNEEREGRALKPRYSAGYGDVSLAVQKDIFRELNCAKMAGITLSDSLHMIPEKSVTAFIGICQKD